MSMSSTSEYKKDFYTAKLFLWFSSAMTAVSLLLNALLYRESKLVQMWRKLDQTLLPHFAAIRSIHEPVPDDTPDPQDGSPIIHQRDILNRLRSYEHILTIGRVKALINTLLIIGLSLTVVFGTLGLLRRRGRR